MGVGWLLPRNNSDPPKKFPCCTGPQQTKIMNGRMSGMTFAVLNSDGVPEGCDLEQWQRWFFEGGGRNQMRIKRDLVNHREIETLFRGNSVEIGQGTIQGSLERAASTGERICRAFSRLARG